MENAPNDTYGLKLISKEVQFLTKNIIKLQTIQKYYSKVNHQNRKKIKQNSKNNSKNLKILKFLKYRKIKRPFESLGCKYKKS